MSKTAGTMRPWAVTSVLACALAPAVTRGQSPFVPLTPPPSEQSAQTFFSTNGMTAESVQAAAAPDPESRNPLRWGPFSARPRIDYQYINASGIRQGDATVSTIQHVINPAVGLQLGRQWHMDAGVSMGYYSDKALNDTFGYNVGLNGSLPREEWNFGVSAGFGASESSQVETAQQTSTQNYNLGFTAVYGAQRRLYYDFGLNQGISLSSGFNDSYSWTTMNWANYVATTKTTLGLGLGGGYTILEAGEDSFSTTGTDSANEQVQGRVVWRPVDKLSVSLSGGAQIQQFLAESGVLNSVSPIYSLSAGYTPVDGTSFTLSGSRTVSTGLTSDEYTESTSLSLGFSQRLLGRLTLGITPSYGLTDYRSNTDPTADASRSDEVYSINVSLSTTLLKKLSVSTFFSYSDNQSDVDYYAYDTRQFGFQVGYRY
jgi:hypothetical protein